jgi:aconitate hydratase
MFLFTSLKGFDPGEDTYQDPPSDGSGVKVDVDPSR